MKFIKAFFATFFSIIFFLVLLGGLFIWGLNSFVAKDNIEKTMMELDTSQFLEIYSDMEEIEIIKEIPEVKKIIAEKSGEAVEYILYHNEIPEFTKEDIEAIINSDYFSNYTNAEKQEIKDSLDGVVDEINTTLKEDLDKISLNDFTEDDSLDLTILFASNIKITIIIILFVLALLIMVSRMSWYRGFSWIGTSTILASLGIIGISNILKSDLLNEAEVSDVLGKILYDSVFTNLLNISYISLGVGIILVVVYFIIKNRVASPEDKKIDEAFN